MKNLSFIKFRKSFNELKTFYLLWSTQTLSALGSAMTNFALIIWSYQAKGSALTTALLTVSSYAPYVLISIFSGVLSDRWNKKSIMLISDTFAAFCTMAVFALLQTQRLEIWHLYILNALNGLMNSFQQPASDVAISLLVPQKYYQKISGLRTFSSSLTSILTPVAAAVFLTFTNLQGVILFDLFTFAVAFCTLLFGIKVPAVLSNMQQKESVFQSAKTGLQFLKQHRGILDLILFLAAINFVASMYEAALPARLLSSTYGETAYGIVNTITGAAMLAGSLIATILPAPKSRVRVICNALLLSMSTENFLLALGKTQFLWCIGAALGWLSIPLMNANMDALFRSYIPLSIQGRVYAVRNTLQFFTIPIGYVLGGICIDKLFTPFMKLQTENAPFSFFFGTGQDAGAAMFLFFLGIFGVLICLFFRCDRHIWALEKHDK